MKNRPAFLLVLVALAGCAPPAQNYFSTHRKPLTVKARAEEEIRFICRTDEAQRLARLSTDAAVTAFLDTFWTRRDPTPETRENEFRAEHLRRVQYANEHLGGSHLDMGRVYILCQVRLCRSPWILDPGADLLNGGE